MVDILMAVISAAAMLGSFYFYWQARTTALKSVAIQQFDAQQSYRSRVIDWASEVCSGDVGMRHDL